jgi:hypothetical protein
VRNRIAIVALCVVACVIACARSAEATTRRGIACNSAASGTDVSVTTTGGTTTGDLVLFVLHINDSPGVQTVTDNNGSTPATKILPETTGGEGYHTGVVFERRIIGGDPTTWHFTISSSDRWTICAITYETPHATTVDAGFATTTTDPSDGVSLSVPSVTTTTSNAIHLSIAMFDGGGNSITATPSGYTTLYSTDTEQDLGIAEKVITSASATGTTSWTDSADWSALGISVALRDSGGGSPPPGGMTTVTLCASGCTYTMSEANLQTAINNANQVGGTTILLEAGATLTGSWILKQHTGTAWVTIKTGVDSSGGVLASSNWPDADDRLIPPSYTGVTNESGLSTNYSGTLTKLIAPGSNISVFRTQHPGETSTECPAPSVANPCVAHHYKLELLDISGPTSADGSIVIQLGSNSVSGDVPSGNTQDTAADEPHDFVLNQVYVHGRDSPGGLHGVMVAARDVAITNSYLSNFWRSGADAQAIWVINATRGITIDNNYVEASGENFMAGGDDPRMNFTSTGITLSASTTTTATLTSALPDYMQIGDCVSVLIATVKQQACIQSISNSGSNLRRVVTFSSALAAAPDVPGMMRGGVVTSGIVVTNNWFNTPISWKGTSKGDTRKNIFELKNARNVTVSYNVFSNVWHAGQNGYAIVFTPINQSPSAYNDSTRVSEVTFSYNVVENMVGCFNISGIDGDNAFSQRTENIVISHTACVNMSSTTYASTDFPAMAIGAGRIPASMLPKTLTFDHLFFDHKAGNSLFLVSIDRNSLTQVYHKLEGFKLTNSVVRSPGTYGAWVFCPDEGCYTNTPSTTWGPTTSGAICTNNALGAESSGQWTFCPNSLFPTNAQLDAALVNYAGGDYRVDQDCGSPATGCYDNAASDSTDIGPNWVILSPRSAAARSGVPGTTTGPPPPGPDPPTVLSVGETLTISAIDTPTLTDLAIIPQGNIILAPSTNEVLPYLGYQTNLGRLTRKFLALHAAELWVETLVAHETMATIGGRILVAPTTTLTTDLMPSDSSIVVKHNDLENGDVVYMEGNGFVEFMTVTSNASGAGPYTYSVTRNLDGTGANAWTAGDAILDTGQTGDGFIDIYSVRGVNPSATELGPSIVFNQRESSTYNDWAPRAAIGNLAGVYGYSSTTYGFAAGVESGARITADATNGIRIFGGDNDAKVTIDTSGNATFDGKVTIGTGRNMIRNSDCTVSTDDWFVSDTITGLTSTLNGPWTLGTWGLGGISNDCYISVSGTPPDGYTVMYGGGPATSRLFPVKAASRYEASAYLGVHRSGNTYVQIHWYQSDSSTFISGSTGTTCTAATNGGATLAGYCRSGIVATAPTGAAYAQFVIISEHTVEADPYIFVVHTYFGEAGSAQEDLTEWGPGGITTIGNGLIETNAINARTIAAGTITASKIQAGTITSLELGAGSVTDSELAANAVTAAAILSGTITGTQIAGGTITTSHIAANTIEAGDMNVSDLSAISANIGSINAGSVTGISINGSTISGGTININSSAFTVNSSGDLNANLAVIGTGTITDLLVNDDLDAIGTITFDSLDISDTNAYVCSNNGVLYASNASCDGTAPAPASASVADLAAQVAALQTEIAELRAALAQMLALQRNNQ